MSEKEINNLIQTGEAAKSESPVSNKEAEEYAEARLEDLKAENNNRKKRLIKLGTMLTLTVLILIFTTIAWFSMNRTVETSGMGVKAAGSPFELEVRGDNIENSIDFDKADDNYQNGENQNLTPTTYQTSGQYNKIIWRKTGAAADDGHYSDGLSPNSHGKLTFWVVPNSTGTLDIEFKFKVRGFIGTYTPAATEGAEPTLNDLFEVTDNMEVTAENGLKDATDLAKKKAALEYIQGHILFFSDFDGTNYSGFLGTGRSISFGDCIDPSAEPKAKYNAGNPVSVTEGQKYQVTIYWKWANTFEQMVFDEDSALKDSPLFAKTNADDKALIISYLGNSSVSVFEGVSREIITTNLAKLTNNSTTDDAECSAALTDKYNDADQIIGNNLDYILIEMSAS